MRAVSRRPQMERRNQAGAKVAANDSNDEEYDR